MILKRGNEWENPFSEIINDAVMKISSIRERVGRFKLNGLAYVKKMEHHLFLI